MKVVAFTGMPWAGKSEAVEIAKKMEIPVFRMGGLVWREVEQRGLPLNDENVGKIADQMRQRYGMDIWARKTLEEIEGMLSGDERIIVIDGVRNLDEVACFKSYFGHAFILIAIIASSEIRYKRALTRKRKDDSGDIEVIKNRDKRELSWGLGTLIQYADITISNEGTIEQFRKQVEKVLSSLRKAII